MSKIAVCLALFLAPCLLFSQEFSGTLKPLKTIRSHWAELRGNFLPDEQGQATIVFQDKQGKNLVKISTDCSQYGRLKNQLCIAITTAGTHLHRHVTAPASLKPKTTLICRRQGNHFQVLTPDTLIFQTIMMDSLKGKAVASINAQGMPCLQDPKVQKLGPIVFADDFMRTDEEAKSLGLWQPVSGIWQIHSVMETIQANPAARIRKGKIPVPDRSPNPFTLSGSSKQGTGLIVTGYAFWSDYEIAVTSKPHISTTGLVFSYLDPRNYWSIQWNLSSLGTHPSLLKLVQTQDGKDTIRAQVMANGRSDNWYRLAVALQGTNIKVRLDDVPVISYNTNHCTGGKVGLLTQGANQTFFDDFLVRSLTELKLSPTALTGIMTPSQQKAWSLVPATGNGLVSQLPHAALTVGTDDWAAQRLTADVELPQRGTVTLGFGNSADLRMSLQAAGEKTRLNLTRQNKEVQVILLPFPTGKANLTLDCTQLHTVRVFLNGILTLHYQDSQLPHLGGAISLTADKPKTVIHGITCFQTEQRDWEKPVDVKKFANDPFMQGWASNRYAWNRTKPLGTFPQTYVFSGDVYGAFSLKTPIINGLNYQFGHDEASQTPAYVLETKVDTKSKTATVSLCKGKHRLAETTLTNLVHKVIPGIQIIDEKIGKRPKTPDTPAWGTMTFHRDGYLFWIEQNGRTVLTAQDTSPATGRVITATVPHNLDFFHINLVREHIRDYLFEKAESDWTATGRWEVTNRFACDPRWSHMNGESFGVAALWSKFQLQGDFTIECFAGMRMRQGPLKGNSKLNYPRVGDINCALMADGEDLFSGYNLIIQAWDSTWSESLTSFMRETQSLQNYHGQLIPSVRLQSPKHRIIPVDYDPGGRALHGAWYALKIRKTVNRYQVWFDNHKVIDCLDPKPLNAHRKIALWTQNNSIVLARVKVNYRQLIPDSPLKPLPPAPLPQDLVDSSPAYTSTLLPPLPAPPPLPELSPWNGDQSAAITLLSQNGSSSIAVLRNQNSGGDFGATIRIPTKNQLLAAQAIEFDYRCSPQTKLNLYLGAAYAPLPNFFVPITGPTHTQTELQSLGAPLITQRGSWTHVAIPLARRIHSFNPWFTNHQADYLMIGMLHEDYLNAGFKGNQKDQWFAIKNVSIRTLDCKQVKALPQDQRFHLIPPKGSWNLAPISIKLAGLPTLTPKLITNATLEIANLPEAPNNSPDTRRKRTYFQLNDTNTTLKDAVLTLTVRELPFSSGTAFFKLVMDEPVTGKPFVTTWSQPIDPKLDKTPPEPPVILGTKTLLTDPTRGLEDLKPRSRYTNEFFCRQGQAPTGYPSAQIIARASGTHMLTDLNILPIDANLYPLLFFDVKIEKDTFITMLLHTSKGAFHLGLTDTAIKKPNFIGFLPGFKNNQQWQTVALPLLDYMNKHDNSKVKTLQRQLTHLSFGDYDYSGSFPGASFQLSNVRFAKTVAACPENPLKLTWQAKDLGGIAKYAFKWSSKPQDEPNLSLTQTDNHLTATDLPNGLHFLHLKACDTNGNWSQTTHQPFMINNARPKLIPLAPIKNAKSAPKALEAALTDWSSPLDKSKARLILNGKTTRLRATSLTGNAQSGEICINLMPAMTQIYPPFPDETPCTATLTGLRNSQGTEIPPCTWNWIIDYSQDHQPPAPPKVIGYNTFYHYNQPPKNQLFIRTTSKVSVVTDDLTKSPCLQLNSTDIFFTWLHHGAFSAKTHSHLMFQCRLASKSKVELYLHTGHGDQTIPLTPDKLKADNQWHQITIDLAKLSNPKTVFKGIAIGLKGKSTSAQQLRVDNVALIPRLSPIPLFRFMAEDATGINAYLAEISRKPMVPKALETGSAYGTLPPVLLQETGLWYLNLACKDAAGNASETIHLPFWCETPIQPDMAGVQRLRSWKLFPFRPKQKRTPGMYLKTLTAQNSQSNQQSSHFLHLRVAKGRKIPAFLVMPLSAAQQKTLPTTLTADLLLSSNYGAALTLRPVLLSSMRKPLLLGKPCSLKTTTAWQRNLSLELPVSQNKLKDIPHYLGVQLEISSRKTADLLFQNIRIQP